MTLRLIMFFGIFWCSSIWSSILDLEPVHYGVFLGISVVGQGPGFATSAAQQSAIGLPRRGIHQPKLTQCNFDVLMGWFAYVAYAALRFCQTWGSFMVLCTASIPLMGQKPCQLHCKVANTRMDGSRYSSTTGWTSFRIRIITREKHRPLYRYIASCDFHLLVPFLAALTTSSVLVQTTSSGWMAILLVIAALSLSKASLMKFCLSSLAGKCFGSIGWSHES